MTPQLYRLLPWLSACLTIATASGFDPKKIIGGGGSGRCELITMESCLPVQYNYTIYPNILGHTSQKEAAEHMEQWKPLTNAKCSDHLRFFVCSIFTPMCDENHKFPVTSCRAVCEEVKESCSALLAQFKMEWPEVINCSKFPESPKSGVCMAPETLMGRARFTNPDGGGRRRGDTAADAGTSTEDTKNGRVIKGKSDHGCPPDMMDSDPFDVKAPCLLRCNDDLMFDKTHKEFAEVWMACLAMLCLIVTAFTVITYILDTDRFRFPERSIIYMAACYHLLSWAYLARVALQGGGGSAGCEQLKAVAERHLVAGSLNNPKCVLTFMTIYYFSMSAGLWWVVLTISWYLSAGKKWGSEAIQAYSSYFHFLAWGAPALMGIAVLVTHKVDASELTKVCSVGNTDPYAMLGFVVAPRLVCLAVGGCFVCAGFTSILSVRKALRSQMLLSPAGGVGGVGGTATSKAYQMEDIRRLDKLMVKIGIFSVLYVLPTVCVIITDAHHAYVLFEWMPQTVDCKLQTYKCQRPVRKPKVELYMLNIFMSVIVGVTTGMWVWSGKTCATWRRRILCCDCMRGADDKQLANGAVVVAGGGAASCGGAGNPQSIPLIEQRYQPQRGGGGANQQAVPMVPGGAAATLSSSSNGTATRNNKYAPQQQYSHHHHHHQLRYPSSTESANHL